ncbi:unnamed protein product [Aphis gossypii]|uniref:Macro domain-containing protein n=2 Tax=Aphis gossypii TaxID=80765 RepID=A0A9P0IMH1_APHGO|nr:unnamed protein product [Aphis gossypii]
MLRLILEKRKQLPDEQSVSYINEVESLCRRIDKHMSQGEIVRNIFKGLKPDILRCIGILENKTLDELKRNIRKYELIEFMTIGSINKSPFEIESEIIQNKTQKINTIDIIKDNEINKLRDEIENLKTTVEQLISYQINNNKQQEIFFNNIHEFTKNNSTLRYNNDNDTNNDYNINYKNNNSAHITCQLCNKFGHSAINCRSTNNDYKTPNAELNTTDNYSPLITTSQKQIINKINFIPNAPNTKTRFHYQPYNYSNFITQKRQCSICLKNNHSEDKCYFKDKPRLVCQICNKFGHLANNCSLYVNKTKKVKDQLNPVVSIKNFTAGDIIQKTNKIDSISNTLHINAIFNDKLTPITIDTGANICCIRQELLTNEYTIMPSAMQLLGADNKPISAIGITKIKININNKNFDVDIHVVKNLSSLIILGNDFLIKNNALIDFKNNNIILNNNINNNIKELKGSIFNCPDNFAIAHCISADLKMNKGITNLICKVYGDTSPQLALQELNVGNTIPINNNNKTIFHLITKKLYYHKPKYEDLKTSVHNLKLEAIRLNILKIAIPTLISGPHEFSWSIIKQLIYSEFENTNIEIYIYHKDEENITQNWKSKEHTEIINNIHTFFKNSNNKNKIKTNDMQPKNKVYNIFSMHKTKKFSQ